MAREATARLYDVDEDSLVYKRPKRSGKYDHGTIAFSAKKGKLVDLDKLHESIWATRLSGGTRSGLVRLDVTAVGDVVEDEGRMIVNVSDSNKSFVLLENDQGETKSGAKTEFREMLAAINGGQRVVKVTGRVEGWGGLWPDVLRELPEKPQPIIVTGFQIAPE